jgi:hypothetical protein
MGDKCKLLKLKTFSITDAHPEKGNVLITVDVAFIAIHTGNGCHRMLHRIVSHLNSKYENGKTK